MSDIILRTENLGISFGGLKAVQGLNLEIHKKQLYGLVGPNGAGKTTVFNLLTKVYQPTRGTILLDGMDTSVVEGGFNEDGSISEVIQTSSGVGEAIPASAHIPANLACELSGHVRIAGDEASSENLVLSEIRNGDTALFRYLDFSGENHMTVRVNTTASLRVELYIDGLYHAEMRIAPTAGYAETAAEIPPLHGRHTVTWKFYCNDATARISAEALEFH